MVEKAQQGHVADTKPRRENMVASSEIPWRRGLVPLMTGVRRNTHELVRRRRQGQECPRGRGRGAPASPGRLQVRDADVGLEVPHASGQRLGHRVLPPRK